MTMFPRQALTSFGVFAGIFFALDMLWSSLRGGNHDPASAALKAAISGIIYVVIMQSPLKSKS